jgi:hypothetical protein
MCIYVTPNPGEPEDLQITRIAIAHLTLVLLVLRSLRVDKYFDCYLDIHNLLMLAL